MHGNVYEWCQDWYDSDYYKNSPSRNPENTTAAAYRVLRGGSWSDAAVGCRIAGRNGHAPANRSILVGFRVVFVP